MDLELGSVRARNAAADLGPAVVVLARPAKPPGEMNLMPPRAIEAERLLS
jgi:hypothetical protein